MLLKHDLIWPTTTDVNTATQHRKSMIWCFNLTSLECWSNTSDHMGFLFP